jgi:1-acyl-sn-glycerol-3-phosphate acyltransferase
MPGSATIILALIVLALAARWLVRLGDRAQGADWGHRWLNCLDGLNRLFCRHYHRLRKRRLRLPSAGAALLVANHVSGLDPLLMFAVSPRPLRFIIAREQYDRWWLRWLFRALGCIPVERGSNSRTALAHARHALAAGEVVALFPFGGIHLEHQGPGKLRRGIQHLARASGAPVYPLRLSGIRGLGLVTPAVFLRSRARIRFLPVLYYDEKEPDRLLAELTAVLSNRRP